MDVKKIHKPVNQVVKHVGNTYGERKQLQGINSIPIQGQQIQRVKDYFGNHSVDPKTIKEIVEPRAQYLGVKNVQPHRLIEAGRANRIKKISDDIMVTYLNKIIAEEAMPSNPPKKTVKSSG